MQTMALKKQRGYTLLEVMVVLIILGILAAIAYPSYLKYVRNARLQNAKTELGLVQNKLEKYYAQNHRFRNASDVYPNTILTGMNADNKYFKIDFYSTDENGVASEPNLTCSPGSASDDQYCLYAGPIEDTNAGETRFLFANASGSILECEIGGAAINASGVVSNILKANCQEK